MEDSNAGQTENIINKAELGFYNYPKTDSGAKLSAIRATLQLP